jgi:hypothetical protein
VLVEASPTSQGTLVGALPSQTILQSPKTFRTSGFRNITAAPDVRIKEKVLQQAPRVNMTQPEFKIAKPTTALTVRNAEIRPITPKKIVNRSAEERTSIMTNRILNKNKEKLDL